MATHIHLHLHPGMFGQQSTADAGSFEESKHKREGGKFATMSGTAQATGRSAYAARHGGTPHGSRESAEAKRQAEYEKAKAKAPLL